LVFSSPLGRERSAPALKPPAADWKPKKVEHSDARVRSPRSEPSSRLHSVGAPVVELAPVPADSRLHVVQRVAVMAHPPHQRPASSAAAGTTLAAAHSDRPWPHWEPHSMVAALVGATIELSPARWFWPEPDYRRPLTLSSPPALPHSPGSSAALPLLARRLAAARSHP
jgi:hypothetical protein